MSKKRKKCLRMPSHCLKCGGEKFTGPVYRGGPLVSEWLYGRPVFVDPAGALLFTCKRCGAVCSVKCLDQIEEEK